MKWPERVIDELGTVSRGRSRHRPRNDPSLYDGPYPFIQTADVKHADLYITDHTQTYNDLGLAQSKLWPKDTLCITIAANIADTALLSYEACFPDSIIGFIADPKESDVRYVKYFFDLMQTRFKQISQGAAQDNLSQKKLLSIKIPAPPVAIQRKIADILTAYADLIDNNNRRITLLEEAIHRLYREWFVHLRFPGHEQTPVVDGVPEGWEKRPLGEVININPKTKYEKGKPSPYVPMAAVSESSMVISGIEERPIKGGPKFINGDTLLARITPCLENGKTGFVQFLETDEIVASGSTEFIVLREDMLSRYWIYCLARTHEFRQHAINSMVGSDGRQRVQPVSVMGYQVPVPPKPIVSDFDDYAQKIFKQINTLNRQNGKLREARDALLPRLMNGSLVV